MLLLLIDTNIVLEIVLNRGQAASAKQLLATVDNYELFL